IVENCRELKDELSAAGYEFCSDTDTEIISHMIRDFTEKGNSLLQSAQKAFEKIEGSYAVAVMSDAEPGKVVVTRRFSPLVIACGEGECFVASDIPAILPYAREFVFLEDNDFAVLDGNVISVTDVNGEVVERSAVAVDWDSSAAEKSGYRHYMLKEIFEQPQAIFDTLRGRFTADMGEVVLENVDPSFLHGTKRIIIAACGTSYHASLIGKYMIEEVAGVNTQVELASEFRYRNPVAGPDALFVAVSQSGETADTSEALLKAKNLGMNSLGITNVMLSKISRESDCVITTKAGPEIGVASTKSFTAQVMAFYLLSIYIALLKKVIDSERAGALVADALSVSKLQQRTLELDSELKDISKDFHGYRNFVYLGRGINYPVALEGALKLKEVSYIHAEGYAAGEIKHGPIALIDKNMPVVFIAPEEDVYYRKLLGNFEEVKARGGRIIFITSDENLRLPDGRDRKIVIPKSSYLVSPMVSVIPAQFLAYHVANLLGTDVDQPRNLAKVVTVE
ncbi:MAG: glutamine--fructose-6-phosphate transaminase (isomerizing), partial [Candidatus Dadabacteria bacterium]|nr:glutamine--fructose-6-phosphate transaminase (isomerizing) [Candidatus Dadabacteria bacterium]